MRKDWNYWACLEKDAEEGEMPSYDWKVVVTYID